MCNIVTYLKLQNHRRLRQGSLGGWLEAGNLIRCQPKDLRNPSVASRFLQARFLSNLCTTCALIALASIVFAVGSPASADSCSRAFGHQGGLTLAADDPSKGRSFMEFALCTKHQQLSALASTVSRLEA
jgi:hypothetical protein